MTGGCCFFWTWLAFSLCFYFLWWLLIAKCKNYQIPLVQRFIVTS